MSAVPLAGSPACAWHGDLALLTPGFRDLPECAGRTIGRIGDFSFGAGDGSAPARASDGVIGVFQLVRCLRKLTGFPRFNRVRKMITKDEPTNSCMVEVVAMMPADDIPLGATASCPVTT